MLVAIEDKSHISKIADPIGSMVPEAPKTS